MKREQLAEIDPDPTRDTDDTGKHEANFPQHEVGSLCIP